MQRIQIVETNLRSGDEKMLFFKYMEYISSQAVILRQTYETKYLEFR